ncbi:MAG: hypothetical protein RL211_70 [Pseudomonadota bacterium]
MADSTILQPVSLHELRLGNALALLKHGGTVGSLVSPQESSMEYLQGIIDSLCDLSVKDSLTGLVNRRLFHAVLKHRVDLPYCQMSFGAAAVADRIRHAIETLPISTYNAAPRER